MKVHASNPVRYLPDPHIGLTKEQVAERQQQNLVNIDQTTPTKSIGCIIRDNVCTLFNLVIMLLGVAVLAVGSYKNLLFVGIMICNTCIGIIQEIHTKRAIDKLSLLSEAKARAIRNGAPVTLAVCDIVLDDILEFTRGNQIVTDCILLDGECDVNESLITGESDAIHKKRGDMLLSGSFVVNGHCRARVEHIGEDNYVAHISSGAKTYKKTESEIMLSLRKIIRAVSIAILPIGSILFFIQYNLDGMTLQEAVVSTTAALIGMIPEGLVLLTSSVLAVSVIRLARYKVMVQELYCIEALARVDVLCLDKTGTLTEGNMICRKIIPLQHTPPADIEQILGVMGAAMKEDSPTIEAIANAYPLSSPWKPERIIHFSSEKKWSGMYTAARGSFILGAPTMILKDMPLSLRRQIEELAQENRVLLLASSTETFPENGLPHGLTPLALVLIQDIIRSDAKDTLRYFRDAGVDIKVISGDDPVTVSSIARRVELPGADRYVDATTLSTPEELQEAVETYTVFGRVSPQQKKDMVKALQAKKHIVAMTGDGVNDVLALKEANCSIAMASGSDAARNVAQLVLLDSHFSAMPQVVAEGRRSINNLQRSASLFIVKTIYSMILSVLFLLIHEPYPFAPIQLTLISSLTIGIPSFVLAMEPNRERIQGKFIRNIFEKALPSALTIILHILLWTLVSPALGLEQVDTSTLCVISTGFTGILLIFTLSHPFNWIRKLLLGFVIVAFTGCILLFPNFFSLTPSFTWLTALLTGVALISCLVIYSLLTLLFSIWRAQRQAKEQNGLKRKGS